MTTTGNSFGTAIFISIFFSCSFSSLSPNSCTRSSITLSVFFCSRTVSALSSELSLSPRILARSLSMTRSGSGAFSTCLGTLFGTYSAVLVHEGMLLLLLASSRSALLELDDSSSSATGKGMYRGYDGPELPCGARSSRVAARVAVKLGFGSSADQNNNKVSVYFVTDFNANLRIGG